MLLLMWASDFGPSVRPILMSSVVSNGGPRRSWPLPSRAAHHHHAYASICYEYQPGEMLLPARRLEELPLATGTVL